MFKDLSLLEKERDFLELNKKLGEKVESLMLDVDAIINNQEATIRTSKIISSQWLNRSKNHSKAAISESHNIQLDNEFKLNNENIKSTIEEDIFNDDEIKNKENEGKRKYTTNETIIRFLKAQIIKYQSDMQAAQLEIKKKDERCKELEVDKKKIEEKKDKLLNQLSLDKESITKINALNMELQSKIQNQSVEINLLRKEIEGLNRDLKTLNQLASNNDVRLNRSLEENEKLKSTIKIHHTEEKDLREQIRKIQEEKRISLKNLEKQREEIFQAFKKQTSLVDNLKKQKAYLEASKEVQFVEENFTKLLDWKPDKI